MPNLKDVMAQFPDFGETFYLVDANFRTQAQGWSRADGTGPIDLWAERNPGYVFGSGGVGSLGYSTDATAAQAAIDAMVDFRGDKLLFTPGAYSIATDLAMNVPGARYLGPPVRQPRRAAVAVTCTATASTTGVFAVSVDDVEIGFMRLMPITAGTFAGATTGSDGGYVHDVWYDTTGVTASTSTEFMRAPATVSDWLVERGYFLVSGLQGDCFTWTTATRWVVQHSIFCTMTASYASVFTLATDCTGNVVRDCDFTADVDGTYTNIFTGAANENGQLSVLRCYVNGTALATAGDIETGFGTATDIEIAECYQTGDATTEGGTLIKLT